MLLKRVIKFHKIIKTINIKLLINKVCGGKALWTLFFYFNTYGVTFCFENFNISRKKFKIYPS